MAEGERVVATYNVYIDVEDAVVALHRSGYDVTQLSILYAGSRIEERIVGFFSEDQRVRYWAKWGVIWGSVIGLMAGVSLFYSPSVTAVLVIKLMAAVLAGGLVIGGLIAGGAVVYGKVLTVDVPLKYASAVEGQDLFSLVTHDKELTARAREALSLSGSAAAPPEQVEATESAVDSKGRSGIAWLVTKRRRARLSRGKGPEGTKV